MMGISAGFASVFGTPLAGAIFGIEVLALGSVSYDAIAPCVVAAFLAEMVTRAWGVHHTIYTVTQIPAMSVRGLLAAMVAGVAFGLMAMLFAETTHAIKRLGLRLIPWAPVRPFVGGALVAGIVFSIGTAHTARFLGLGIPEIVAAFHQQLPPYDFAVKSFLTSLTLGTGFKGGEVTPLFFIGATMGNALSHILPLPASLLAGMGFVAVFAGAANTPIASTLMAVELFGAEVGAFAGIAETGTLMLVSGPNSPTTLNLMPDTHIVVLRADQIVGPYEEALDRLRVRQDGKPLPRTVNFITGPSRTADIEQKIELGAHGPRRWPPRPWSSRPSRAP